MIARFAPVLLCLMLAAGPVAAQRATPYTSTTLDLSATGEVKAAPDQAVISFGVQTQAKAAAAAMRANADQMTASIAALRKAGVEAKDIQTSAINLSGQYSYEQNQPPKLIGYQAVNQVSVIVRNLARLGPTVDALTAAGVNQVNGIEFGISEPQPLQDEARRRAVKTLQARAELYAGAAGMRVGRLVNLSEGGGEAPIQPMAMAGKQMLRAAAAPTPVEPGQLTVRIDVSAIYELVK